MMSLSCMQHERCPCQDNIWAHRIEPYTVALCMRKRQHANNAMCSRLHSATYDNSHSDSPLQRDTANVV